ncbi:MAG: hypothetical protein ACR2ID_01465 [Chthoniobacterales bacterium]
MISDQLAAIERRIASELTRRPECFIVHPAEVRTLQPLAPGELRDLAQRNGWRVVRRLGGRQFQFYNDTFARLARSEGEAAA